MEPGKHSSGVRVVVIGHRGTGKSTLIAAAASESSPENVPPVLPPTRLPPDFYPDFVPVTIIDTSSSLGDRAKLFVEAKRADVVVITYACDTPPMTVTRLNIFWLRELRRIEVNAPIIVVGCKLDLREKLRPISVEQLMAPVMKEYREIETCLECSAANFIQVPEVFYYAQKAVLYPTAPLFDQETQDLKPRCMKALKRIFILFDHDMDGALSDDELNDFQVKCFNAPLHPTEILGVKTLVQEKFPQGVNQFGLTPTGFLFLNALFIDKGRLEMTWTVLRKFGYDNDLKLRDDYLPVPIKRAPDQTVELTIDAVRYLSGVFQMFDTDHDGALRIAELEDLFSNAPKSPWDEAPYKDAAQTTALGNLSLDGFLAEWALMTLLDPRSSLAYLIYSGYGGDPASALRVTRRRLIDRKKQQTDRNVFQCFVFGSKNAGKSSLLNSFLGRPFLEDCPSTAGERYVTNVVNQVGDIKKTLILREIPENGVAKVLSNKESLAACNVAIFVYDSSCDFSWKRTRELLMEVARLGEQSGYGVPCLLIAAKNDLDSNPMIVQESARVTLESRIEEPIPVSMKAGELNDVFLRILGAAEHPHLRIPETESGRNRKQNRHHVNHSLVLASIGAAATLVGLSGYQAYALRRNASS